MSELVPVDNSTDLTYPTSPPAQPPAKADTDSWIAVVSDVINLANVISETEFVPKKLRGNAPAAAAAMLYGREVGLAPMTSLSQTHVVEGRPAISAEGMRAMILGAGHELEFTETTGAVCTVRGRRKGSDRWQSVSWTIDQARAAGLTGKDNWKSYPRQMLQARATAELARLAFPDVIHGFAAVEELDETGEPSDTPATTGRSKVQRNRAVKAKKSEPTATPPASTPADPPASTMDEGPPLPGDDSSLTTPSSSPANGEPSSLRGEPGGGEDQPPTTSSPPPPSEATTPPMGGGKRKAVFAALGRVAVGDDERHAMVSRILRREVTSFTQMSSRDADFVLDTIAHCKTRADLDALLDAVDESPTSEPITDEGSEQQ